MRGFNSVLSLRTFDPSGPGTFVARILCPDPAPNTQRAGDTCAAERYRANVSGKRTGLPPTFPRGRPLSFAVLPDAARRFPARRSKVVANTTMRRPLPAVIALAALLLLTAIVWWRGLNRDSGASTPHPCSTRTHPAATLPAPNLVTVQVLNSTDRQGIADKVRSTLVNDGFNSPDPAANDTKKAKIPGVAQIRYGSKGANGAKLLHYYFPKAKL